MRYSVKCNECGKSFLAETANYGIYKYRCPYCGNVVKCRFNAPRKLTKARSVIPVADATQVGKNSLPLVETTLVSADHRAAPMPEAAAAITAKGRGAGAAGKAKKGVSWFFANLAQAFCWSSGRIQQFREENKNADLWLFFGFSAMFILLVFCGLFAFAEITKALHTGHSWLFRNYLDIKNSL